MNISNTKKRKTDKAGVAMPTVEHEQFVAAKFMAIETQMQEMISQNRTRQVEVDFLKTRCDHLGARCSSLENSLEKANNKIAHQAILIRNQKWEYSVPTICYSDLRSFGYDEEIIHQQQIFLDQIEQETYQMRLGKGNGNVMLGGHYPPADDQAHVITHNDIFVPHWREFASALKDHHRALKCLPECAACCFQISNLQVPDNVLEILGDALKANNHFKVLSLRNNDLGREGIKFVLQFMKNAPLLEILDLSASNILRSIENMGALGDSIHQHPAITDIVLLDCDNGDDLDGFNILLSVVNNGGMKLKSIELGCNGIPTTTDKDFISDFLEGNPPLESLDLTYNLLDGRDAILIASSLKHNSNLRSLELTGNPISKVAAQKLYRAIFDNTDLNAAAVSNHTCQIGFPSDFDVPDSISVETLNSKECPKENRRTKIYHILSARNRETSNVQHFESDNVSLKEIPQVLVTVQRCSQTDGSSLHIVHPLSIFYEIMRGVEMPSLFENVNARPRSIAQSKLLSSR